MKTNKFDADSHKTHHIQTQPEAESNPLFSAITKIEGADGIA